MDDRDRQAVGRGQVLCFAAPPLGGGTHPCLAEPQPPTGEGCRENNRERGDLALYCQRQADVAFPGYRLPVDVRPLSSAISVCLFSDGDSSQTLSDLRHRLAGRKVKVSIAAIFRFLRHLKLTLRKSPARGLNGTAPTWLRRAEPGDESSGDLIHGSWSSSTRPLSRPTWCAATAGRREDTGWSAKDHAIHCRIAA